MTTTDPTLDAAQTYAELAERVRNGDTTITRQQLRDAKESEEFAELEAEAARRAQQAAQTQEQAARAADLVAAIEQLQGADRQRAVKAYAAAVKALTELQDATAELVDKYGRARGELSSLGLGGGDFGTVAALEQRHAELGVTRAQTSLDRRHIITPGVDYVEHARRDAAGKEVRPHALWTDKRFADYDAAQQRLEEEREARRAEHEKNHEVVVDHGFGNYTRRF
jgi:DNA repair exonuclease SbcCD ATPase subunit